MAVRSQFVDEHLFQYNALRNSKHLFLSRDMNTPKHGQSASSEVEVEEYSRGSVMNAFYACSHLHADFVDPVSVSKAHYSQTLRSHYSHQDVDDGAHRDAPAL